MIEIRHAAQAFHSDVYTPRHSRPRALAPLDDDRRAVMASRIAAAAPAPPAGSASPFSIRRATIARTNIWVQDARDGKFAGSEIPADLQRQWIQAPVPAPNRERQSTRASATSRMRCSGADGWMFDGEDALGQVATMSLDNQRSLKLAIHRDPLFLKVAEEVLGK